MIKRKGEIGMSTMVYIAIGLLVLILMALLIGKSYTNSQTANNGCKLMGGECLTSCGQGLEKPLGYCPEEGEVCCKTSSGKK